MPQACPCKAVYVHQFHNIKGIDYVSISIFTMEHLSLQHPDLWVQFDKSSNIGPALVDYIG